jgi:hypothetical protein
VRRILRAHLKELDSGPLKTQTPSVPAPRDFGGMRASPNVAEAGP